MLQVHHRLLAPATEYHWILVPFAHCLLVTVTCTSQWLLVPVTGTSMITSTCY